MIPAQIPENEIDRLRALLQYDIMDSFAEEAFDDLTALASQICETPIALISLVDEKRQWFKSKVGLNVNETKREHSFCGHTILQNDVLEVKDAIMDPNFKDNPLVTSNPNIRFYAGMPLTDRDGFNLGTLCVIDQKPRVLNEAQRHNLRTLAKQVTALIEARLYKKTIQSLNQAISQQLDFFTSILNNAPAMIAFWDKNLICRFANQDYLALVNKHKDEVIGQHYDQVVPERGAVITKPFISSVLNGEFCKFELRLSQHNIGLCQYKPYFDHAHIIQGFFVVITDIGILKKAEEDSRLLASIFDQTSDAIMITDKKHCILTVNQGFETMYGYKKHEVIGKTPEIFIPYYSNENDLLRIDHKIIDEKVSKTGAFIAELWQSTKKGNLIFCRVSIQAIKNEFNELMYHVATCIDLTEIQKKNAELQLAKEMLERTGKISKLGGWEYDFKKGELTWTNECFRIHEVETNTLPFLEDALSFYQPEARPIIQEAVQECIKTGRSYSLELPLMTAKNKHIWVQTTGELIKANGKGIKLAGTIQDITEKKELEIQKLQHEINLRNTLVREVHHRIKNNLQGVSGLLSHYAYQNPTISEPFNQANAQLQSVAVIHGLQGANNDQAISLMSLIQAISRNIMDIWRVNILIDIANDTQNAMVSINENTPIALILNELITNSVKHRTINSDILISLNSLKKNQKDAEFNIKIMNEGKYITHHDHQSKTPSQDGLGLVTSLMPKTSAYLQWLFEDNATTAILQLRYPVIYFN
jgi:PAS domain S-box-containing protein